MGSHLVADLRISGHGAGDEQHSKMKENAKELERQFDSIISILLPNKCVPCMHYCTMTKTTVGREIFVVKKFSWLVLDHENIFNENIFSAEFFCFKYSYG